MNKVIEWIKGRWKVILIVLLSLMFISKCTSTNNYKRKFHKAETRIDSLELVIKEKNSEISSLTKQLNIYVEQNAQLNARNKDLANKSVVVNIENKKEDE